MECMKNPIAYLQVLDENDVASCARAAVRMEESLIAHRTRSVCHFRSRRYRRVMPEVSEAPFSKTIGELFDFDSPEWAKSIEEFASYRLDKELELFELLDFDAPGELVPAEDGDTELGQSTEDAGLDGLAYDVMEI